MNHEGSSLTLCGVPMSGTLEPDGGLKFIDLVGWWGLPPSRGRVQSKPGVHGAFARKKLIREGRTMALTGEIRTSSNAELHNVRDRLEAALAAGAGEMVLASPSSVAWSRFVEIDTLTIEPDHGRTYTRFTVDLFAPDPRRYGPVQELEPIGLPTATGGVRLPQRMPWNFGAMSAESQLSISNPAERELLQPELIVTGGFSELTVIDTTDGRRLQFDWTVESGSEVVFNSATRRAFLDGDDVTRWMTRKQWFGIEAASTHKFRFEVNDRVGDPQLRARFRIGAW